MPDLSLLYKEYGADKTINLLNRALEMTETNPSITWIEVQNRLGVFTAASYVIVDWLADNFKTRPRMSNHWIRCGRVYVLNNEHTSLEGLMSKLEVGNRTAFQIMLTLEKKGYIKILSDFKFERIKNGTDLVGFERQIKKFAKKYRGRCEPELLERLLYIDYDKAYKLAEHGRDNLGFIWRGVWKESKSIASSKPKKEVDLLYLTAKKLVISRQIASISLLQTNLRWGYNLAKRVINELESKGVIGPPRRGYRYREVLKKK